MKFPFLTSPYETWAPLIARIMFGFYFLFSAYHKIPFTEGFTNMVTNAGAAGVPLAFVVVLLTFLIETIGGIMLIVGWNARLAAFVFLVLMVITMPVFFSDMGGDQTQFAFFVSRLTTIAGLIYLSVYGAQTKAVLTCPTPHGMKR